MSITRSAETAPCRVGYPIRGMIGGFAEVPGVEGKVRLVRTGIRLAGEPPAVGTSPRRLDGDNAEVYGELGLSAADLERLHDEGIV
jgi:crotonobetainyl-CoA:carnitine CoA-transferase CaiB-like acyl-CoA transferase